MAKTTIKDVIDAVKSTNEEWSDAVWSLLIPMGDYIDEDGLFVGHCADCGRIVRGRTMWHDDLCAQCDEWGR